MLLARVRGARVVAECCRAKDNCKQATGDRNKVGSNCTASGRSAASTEPACACIAGYPDATVIKPASGKYSAIFAASFLRTGDFHCARSIASSPNRSRGKCDNSGSRHKRLLHCDLQTKQHLARVR
ncbi:hypothetical protein MGEO_18395, partial [Marivita geojedonensis]